MKNVNSGHRQRMRDRFVAEGIQNLADHEVLEMMLYMCIPYKDTNKIAHNMITSLGSLSAVMDAPIDVLARIGGISTTSATNIALVRAVWERYKISLADNKPARSVKDIVNHAIDILQYSNCEGIISYYIDGSTAVLGHELYNGDNSGSIYINNKDIVTSSLAYNARGVVLVHNHPQGANTPSVADLKYTEGLYNTLKGIDVTLLDHVIVGDGGCHSMALHGTMSKIREKYNK